VQSKDLGNELVASRAELIVFGWNRSEVAALGRGNRKFISYPAN